MSRRCQFCRREDASNSSSLSDTCFSIPNSKSCDALVAKWLPCSCLAQNVQKRSIVSRFIEATAKWLIASARVLLTSSNSSLVITVRPRVDDAFWDQMWRDSVRSFYSRMGREVPRSKA